MASDEMFSDDQSTSSGYTPYAPGDQVDSWLTGSHGSWTHPGHLKQEPAPICSAELRHVMTSRHYSPSSNIGEYNSMMTPEAEARLQVRRERNKQAAARCRQRRVDLTNHLLAETGMLEEERAKLQLDVHKLQQQRHHLELVLKSHSTQCSAPAAAGYQPSERHVTRVDYNYSSNQRPAHIPVSRSAYYGSVQYGYDGYGSGMDDCLGAADMTGLTPVIGENGQPSFDVISGDIMMAGNSTMVSPTTLMTL